MKTMWLDSALVFLGILFPILWSLPLFVRRDSNRPVLLTVVEVIPLGVFVLAWISRFLPCPAGSASGYALTLAHGCGGLAGILHYASTQATSGWVLWLLLLVAFAELAYAKRNGKRLRSVLWSVPFLMLGTFFALVLGVAILTALA